MPDKKMYDAGFPRHRPSESYWQNPPHILATYQSINLQSSASVVIIGSGISGTSTAFHLLMHSPNLDIVLLEARTITSGATGRNGGHCKDVPFKTYKKWKTQFGEKAAQRLAKFRSSHVDITRQLAQELSQDGFTGAQFRDVESVTAVFDSDLFKELKANMENWLEDFPEHRKKCLTYEGMEAQEKFGLIGPSGVLTSPAGALWPYRLVTSVLQRLHENHENFHLEALTPVLGIEASGILERPYLVHTQRGTIRAQHVVHCTNAYASRLIPALKEKIVPVRGQMTALDPGNSFPRLGHARSWSIYYSNGGFDYMTQAAGPEGDVFLGGGVEQGASEGVVDLGSTNDVENNEPALKHLCSVLPRYFQGGKDAKLKQAWTGIMGFTPDGFPVVDQIPRELCPIQIPKNSVGEQWVAAGFNGYGMVQCWQSGKAIADMISGVPEEETNAWFPKEQFECSEARLQNMKLESLIDTFNVNVPKHLRAQL